MTELGRTPWVDRTLKNTWERISEQVPASWMPETVPGRTFKIEELGCGVYGCVAPVPEPGMVFKITSDVSEARFVTMALKLPPTEGIVEYYKIFALAEARYRNRPLFVLWRQEAKDIGFLVAAARPRFTAATKKRGDHDEYEIRTLREGMNQLNAFLKTARHARQRILELLRRAPREEALAKVWKAFETSSPERDPRYYRGIPRIGILLRQCWGLAMMIQNTDLVYPVGSALIHYMDEGILLADVHANNIGKDKNGHAIITDPGHAVEFHPQWTRLPKVPVI
jgi:hypothetical protein